MMETKSESVLERIPDFTSKIEQLFFFCEIFSINITLKFPPPLFLKMSPNVARIFLEYFYSYFTAELFTKHLKKLARPCMQMLHF